MRELKPYEKEILDHSNVGHVELKDIAGSLLRDTEGNLVVRVIFDPDFDTPQTYGLRVARCFGLMTIDGDVDEARDNGDPMCFRPEAHIVGKEVVLKTTAPAMFRPYTLEKFVISEVGTDFFKRKAISNGMFLRRVYEAVGVSKTGMVEFTFMDSGPNENYHITSTVGVVRRLSKGRDFNTHRREYEKISNHNTQEDSTETRLGGPTADSDKDPA